MAAPGTPMEGSNGPTGENIASTRQAPPPPPYRILSKEYMAQQLPHLQEKAPQQPKEPLEFKTNAPASLPLPSLFPGEVVRMQQHRVVCTDSFEEPAVGVVYVTNFRIIFNGSPVSDPDVYEILYDLQNSTASSKRGTVDPSTLNSHLSGGNIKTLVWKKKQPQPSSPVAPPRQSKFYVGKTEPEDYAGDREDEDGGEDEEKQIAFPTKWFQRLNTIRKSTGAGIKNAIGDISADIAKRKQRGGQQQQNPARITQSVPISSLAVSGDDSVLYSSVPNKPAPPQFLNLEDKPVTLPRNMPSHNTQVTTPPDNPLHMADSGIVDASVETASPSLTSPPLPTASPPNSTSPLSQFSSSGDVFLDASNTDEIDFERSPIDFPLSDDRRRKTGGGRGGRQPRPSSFLGIESDSDSDAITDKYFGSITEEDDNDDITSPESVSSPSRTNQGNYENVVLKVPSPVHSSPGRGGRGTNYENVSLKKPEIHVRVEGEETGGDYENVSLKKPTEEKEDNERREEERGGGGGGETGDDLGHELEATLRVEAEGKDDEGETQELEKTIKEERPTGGDIPSLPPTTDSDKTNKEIESTPELRDTSKDKKNQDTISEKGPPTETGAKVPAKPPRKKKRSKTAADAIDESTEAKRPSLIVEGSEGWQRSHSDGPTRTSTRRRPPPPPKPKTTPAASETLPNSHSALEVKSSSETDLSSPSSPPHVPLHPPLDRNSSLVAVRGSEYVRPLTAYSPVMDSSFEYTDWSGRSKSSSHKLHDSNSLPLNFSTSTSMPYYQYTHTVSLPLSTISSVKHLPPVVLDESSIRIPDGTLVLGKNFSSLKLHFHSSNTFDALKFKEFLENIISEPKQFYDYFAFKYRLAIKLPNAHIFDSRKLPNFFHFNAEMERTGILNAKIGNTSLWRITTITKTNPDLCPSYPEKLVVLLCIPDVDLLRGGRIYEEGRFPTATWMNKSNGSVLLRAAATTSERGLQSSKLPVDEAILQAIRGCNANSRLFVFTEKSDTSGFQDPNKLTKEAARSYYYHNCHFIYSVNPPTYKSVRHSFNKLQAMLQSNISDDEYMVTLDGTKWLSRVGDLLDTAHKVVEALTVESAHVLVCYEKGWDRTTQIVSLAQLLCDPYYRTMDGFQVLIQKEWLWFGHPFQSRHSRSRAAVGGASSKIKEDGPVFLQWIDCVWQITRQCPFAFEFNENLLIALVEHAYSNQFGTFMGNSEKERTQCFMIPDHYHQSIYTNTISFWTWVSMVNSSNNIFFNNYYDPDFHKGAIYPKFYQTCLEIWRTHYDRHKLRQEVSEGQCGTTRLERELHQVTKLLLERQPLSSLSLNVGLTLDSIQSLQTTSSGDTDAPQLGPNPLPPSTQAVLVRAPVGRRNYSSVSSFLVAEGYDPSVCHHVVLSPAKCQGYLTKEGGFMKNWKRRWFVLDYVNNYVAYFESQEHYSQRESPKGVIMLDDIKRVSLSTRRIHLMSNLFQVKTPSRTYNIKAPSIITMEIWMACLRLPSSSLQKTKE
ncbi:PREDICTED: uncharacterized protein LOC100632035 [Amphimedon queenslandica]|uniref:Phosphatidylinositol-3-phosphatase n=1 Tax=Amphimedon queenslandica TaxID=400682 RepID=A0A1X7UYT2_AMPQE|nr:PREDICTED: uncharacterized protein LOC100632035 [Amphimedon queenslandica]|eukprot:XP_003386474.2 PREDICTED: uncharacterized protein LOC100632035 [Amphimedon queenslandica]